MTLTFIFTFLKKIKKRRSLYYIYLIYFILLFLLRGKKVSGSKEGQIFIATKNDVYSNKKRCI
nr:hypothetical protein [Enterococcus casseliflavus]